MAKSMHPQAKFDPIPPDLDIHSLVERTPHFQMALRIDAKYIKSMPPLQLEKLISTQLFQRGKPLVIEKWNQDLDPALFGVDWLERTYDKTREKVRDLSAQADIDFTMGHYLRSMKHLTNVVTPTNFRDDSRQRLYLKDIDCPIEWHERLQQILPRNFFYLNEAIDTKHAVPAGDLMSSLPEDMRAQNLMCYIGHEGTYTPAHREMCASLGQNIMVDVSGDENQERPGSSLWFMTETKDREVVREYFLSMLGHDVEIEKHFAQINAWKKATFPVYIVEQKLGDLILIPPLAPHQVWNRGTRTMKVAWNRTTCDTLKMALHEALPKARLVCRDEQYKNKAIIYYTLKKYCDRLREDDKFDGLGLLGIERGESPEKDRLQADFRKLFGLFTEILVDEMFGSKEQNVEYIEFTSDITCSYCRANIFNRFLTCKHCIERGDNREELTYDVCMECYAMGRSCVCRSNLQWCEQWEWSELVNNYDEWRSMIIEHDGFIDLEHTPPPLEIARKRSGKKSVAQICQEQLRRRPFRDISKPAEKEVLEPSEPEVDDNGIVVKKKKKKRRGEKTGDVYRCHVCSRKDYTYRLAFCSTPGCTEAYCFGNLYRGFDMLPQDVLQEEKWQCPKCRKNCNCGSCRRTGNTTPYVPKNTLLGHDTRRIADPRSEDVLVDFRLHNLGWLNKVGEVSRSQDTGRMQRLREQADAEKAQEGQIGDVVGNAIAIAESQSSASQPSGEETPQPADGHVPVADMSVSQSFDPSAYPDPAAYPDPSAFGADRMLGLGYYEQDDSPDKILFDPYQAPDADDMIMDEESEYAKKSLRAAKRRARQENDDDPDFRAPKSHKKKSKVDKPAENDAVMNLDPALLDVEASFVGQAQQQDGTTNAEAAVQGDADADADDEVVQVTGQLRYEANVPMLRHAKPMVSYAEGDDIEEFNELAQKRAAKPVAEVANVASNDPLDLASEAIRALTGQGSAPVRKAVSTPSTGPKKRGRPPRKSDTGPVGRVTTIAAATPRSEPPKRRGRPPRGSLREEALQASAEDGDDDSMIDALEAQLAAELAEDGEAADTEGQGAEVQATATPVAPAPRRRGRPPKNPGAAGSAASSAKKAAGRPRRSASPVTLSGLTMAQRVALRGGKFRMAGRRSGGRGGLGGGSGSGSGNVTPRASGTQTPQAESSPAVAAVRSPSPVAAARAPSPVADPTSSPPPAAAEVPEPDAGGDTVMEDADAVEEHLEVVSPSAAAQSSPPPSPPKPTGPTVVRLGDSEDEDASGGYVGSRAASPSVSVSVSDSDSDSDDEDIPARKLGAGTAIRGGAIRGGGRGRGRGRPRGRGGAVRI